MTCDQLPIYDFKILQGETFNRVTTWLDANNTPIDLTGWEARMQLRRTIASPTIEFSLTTDNGRLSLGGVNGTVTMAISAIDTATLSGRYFYDLELVNGAQVVRYLQGKIDINPEVTR